MKNVCLLSYVSKQILGSNCLFLFIVADPYKRQERPRFVICPQKEQNLVASLL